MSLFSLSSLSSPATQIKAFLNSSLSSASWCYNCHFLESAFFFTRFWLLIYPTVHISFSYTTPSWRPRETVTQELQRAIFWHARPHICAWIPISSMLGHVHTVVCHQVAIFFRAFIFNTKHTVQKQQCRICRQTDSVSNLPRFRHLPIKACARVHMPCLRLNQEEVKPLHWAKGRSLVYKDCWICEAWKRSWQLCLAGLLGDAARSCDSETKSIRSFQQEWLGRFLQRGNNCSLVPEPSPDWRAS